MKESALRDVERWKDKIEVRLDNRQVFFLFFGSAVVACMLFVLGVIVGKRIESRGRADTLEVQDPLAALDRVHQPPLVAGPAAPPAELTFPKALAKPKPLAATLPKPVAAPKPVAVVPKPVAAPKPLAAVPKAVAVPKPVAVVPKATLAVAEPKPVADPAKAKGKYTLQLSAFPTREEADAFANSSMTARSSCRPRSLAKAPGTASAAATSPPIKRRPSPRPPSSGKTRSSRWCPRGRAAN